VQKKESGALGETERSDYARFITFLSDRIQQYCQELAALGGPSAVRDLPCPDDRSSGTGTPASASPTTAEQVARLDSSLAEALGEFDEMLLKEEQRIAARSPREREAGEDQGGSQGHGGGSRSNSGESTGGMQGDDREGGQAGEGGKAGEGEQQEGTGSEPGTPGAPGQTAGTGQDHSGGSRTGQGGSPSAGGEGAGSDQAETADQGEGMPRIESGYDDIVARQLREAAEKETDPELKEKLWEEYRKYKEGIR